MNRRALELMSHFHQSEIGPVNDILLAPVREFSTQVQKTLERKEANCRDHFELKRVICNAGRKILIRGFGSAGRNSHDSSRIVIVLEEVGFRQATAQDDHSEIRRPINEEPAL